MSRRTENGVFPNKLLFWLYDADTEADDEDKA